MNSKIKSAAETRRHGERYFSGVAENGYGTVFSMSVMERFKKISVISSVSLCLCGKKILGFVAGLLLCLASVQTVLSAEEKWKGIDETVVGKIAREHGREPKEPLINTGEGDLQLFVFLAAGTLGGFVAGYYWRVLLEGKKRGSGDDPA